MRLILIVFLFISWNSISQDTVRVFFDFGSSKMSLKGRNELIQIPEDFNLSDIDSIQFIGYADSVGRIENNLKLSLKRAKSAYKLCRGFLDKEIPYSLLARGEGINKDASINRRVEVILHYSIDELDEGDEVVENVDPKCFFVDFEAMEMCHVRIITKKRKKIAHIEAVYDSYFKKVKHYYLRTNKDGTVDSKRLKWKEKSTGMLWWKKKRFVAEMPQSSFGKFQFFTLVDAPCDGCKESVFTEDTVFAKILISYPDYFLMDNAQTKLKLFGKKRFQIRVPREYVDLDQSYYASHSLDKDASGSLIGWETKRGKKRQNYYFTRLAMTNNDYAYITKHGTTTECRSPRKGTADYRQGIRCGTLWPGGLDGDFTFDISPGMFYENDTITGFLSVGVSYIDNRHLASVSAGINTHLGLYISGKYEYHFLEFPLAALNPVKVWKSPEFGSTHSWTGTFFGGLEVKSITKVKYLSFVEPNLHLGLAFHTYKVGGLLPKFYVKSGIAKDVLNRVNTKFYPFVEMGITFHLF